jgi:hypothetical protein
MSVFVFAAQANPAVTLRPLVALALCAIERERDVAHELGWKLG